MGAFDLHHVCTLGRQEAVQPRLGAWVPSLHANGFLAPGEGLWSYLDPRPAPSVLQLPIPGQGLEIPFCLSNHLHGPVWDHCLSVPRLLRTPEWDGLPPSSSPHPQALGAQPHLSVLVSGYSPPHGRATPLSLPATSCSPLPAPSMLCGPALWGLATRVFGSQLTTILRPGSARGRGCPAARHLLP